MKMKYLIMFLTIVLCFSENNTIIAQHCLSFSYDGNGNREQRILYDCLPDNEVRMDNDIIEETQTFADEQDEEDVIVFPNPTDGIFRIIFKNYEQDNSSYLIMYDVNGQIVLNNLLSGCYNEINITDKLSGAYLLKLICGDKVRSRLILKQ